MTTDTHAGVAAARDVLTAEGLSVSLFTSRGVLDVVRSVDLHVRAGDTVAVVGESGCGKSTLARSLLGLIGPPSGVVRGSLKFQGEEMAGAGEAEFQEVRGTGIGIVFQDPAASLDPLFTVGRQLREFLTVGRGMRRREGAAEAVRLLEAVGIPNAEQRVSDYPHQMSGGMLQRAAIALAISGEPSLLIADEPTTALDATVQAEVLKLLGELVDRLGMSLVLITHDLSVARRVAERVVVMYAGEIVESGPLEEIFAGPAHPYTTGLLECDPANRSYGERLKAIPGRPASPDERPVGCAFAPRCEFARDICRTSAPELLTVAPGRESRCHFGMEVMERNAE